MAAPVYSWAPSYSQFPSSMPTAPRTEVMLPPVGSSPEVFAHLQLQYALQRQERLHAPMNQAQQTLQMLHHQHQLQLQFNRLQQQAHAAQAHALHLSPGLASPASVSSMNHHDWGRTTLAPSTSSTPISGLAMVPMPSASAPRQLDKLNFRVPLPALLGGRQVPLMPTPVRLTQKTSISGKPTQTQAEDQKQQLEQQELMLSLLALRASSPAAASSTESPRARMDCGIGSVTSASRCFVPIKKHPLRRQPPRQRRPTTKQLLAQLQDGEDDDSEEKSMEDAQDIQDNEPSGIHRGRGSDDTEVTMTSFAFDDTASDGTDPTVQNSISYPRKSKQAAADGSYPCPKPGCKSVFRSRFSLRRHTKRHEGHRPFACPHDGCSSAFAERSTLKRHERIHTGERPFACTYAECGKRFADLTNIRRHLATHKRGQVFLCPAASCKRAFRSQAPLDRHKLRDHGILPGQGAPAE